MLILFNDELSSSDRTGRPGKDTAAVQDDSQVFHEANTPNVDDEVLRKRMEKSIVVHDVSHTFRCEARKVPAFDN